MKKYTHSIATYPSNFIGIALSKDRFCLQFQDVVTKLRVDLRDKEQGLIKLPTTERALPLVPHGSEINVLAVRCNEEIILKIQKDLLDKYKEYLSIFPNSNLKDNLKELGIVL